MTLCFDVGKNSEAISEHSYQWKGLNLIKTDKYKQLAKIKQKTGFNYLFIQRRNARLVSTQNSAVLEV